MNRLRVGILGGGGILGSHARGFRAAADLCEVVAVAEPAPEKASRIRELLGAAVRIVPDYRQVIAADNVDAVDIILPHNLHMPATIAAAQAGKPVLVEKVMARNVWECDRMIEACEKAGVSLTVCHDRRYGGEWVALKGVIDTGALGEVFFYKLDHNQDVRFPPGHWARTRDAIGGGAIMSCLTHQIDALRWYGGEVESVTCMAHARPDRMEGEFLGAILARMKSGAMAELSINWWTRSRSGPHALWYEMVQVCGTKGEAYTMNDRGTFARLHEASDEALACFGPDALKGFVKVPAADPHGHTGCIREWAKSLLGLGGNIVTPGRDSRATVEVAEAAYLSEREGRIVRLPITPRPWQ